MKKFLLAFLIFISVTEMKISFAQTYHSFPDTLASWSEYDFGCSGGGQDPLECVFTGYLLMLSHDSLIAGKNYALVGLNIPWELQTYGPIPYPVNYPFQLPGTIIGGLRIDSAKKVWFRKLNDTSEFNIDAAYYFPIDSDILLYDFNIEVGDSLSWTPYEQKLIQMDSIQLLDGNWRKEFVFNTGEAWIEGIGSTFGLFGSYESPPFEGGHFLSCFRQNDSLLLESLSFYSKDCDHVFTGISEVSSHQAINIAPNPTNDFITFDLSDFLNEKFSITIYNSSGQQVNHYRNLHSPRLAIPVAQLGADGLYFYTINFDEKKIFSGKFLVQQ